jgi:hypothetical protein
VQELTVGFAACEGIFQRFAPNAKPRPTPRVAYAYAYASAYAYAYA